MTPPTGTNPAGAATGRPVPYVAKGVAGQRSAAEAFGASLAEYEFWRPHICGVCCLKMIGDACGATTDRTLAELTELCVRHGVFVIDDEGSEGSGGAAVSSRSVRGAYHHPLREVFASFGIAATVTGGLDADALRAAINSGQWVMLSIDLARIPNSPHRGGHLVVVYGYDPGADTFELHDCSSLLAANGEAVRVRASELEQYSNARGLLVNPGPAKPAGPAGPEPAEQAQRPAGVRDV